MKANILYRFLDEHGRLLYVGITVDPVSRFRSHKHTKQWWKDVRQIVMQHYDSRQQLIAAEVEAITTEKPIHNVTHNGHRSSQVSSSLCPNWRCYTCGKRISGKNDALWLSTQQRLKAEQLENWEKRSDRPQFMNVDDLLGIPDEGKWQLTCHRCWRNDYDQYYLIELDRISTWAAVAEWTAHLLESKGFLQYTDWHQVLRNAGAKE